MHVPLYQPKLFHLLQQWPWEVQEEQKREQEEEEEEQEEEGQEQEGGQGQGQEPQQPRPASWTLSDLRRYEGQQQQEQEEELVRPEARLRGYPWTGACEQLLQRLTCPEREEEGEEQEQEVLEED